MTSDKPHRCPSCGNREARPSQLQRVLVDTVMQLFRLFPYRCRVCGLRFYDHPDPEPTETEPPKTGAAGGEA